jgi:hypothetical protein
MHKGGLLLQDRRLAEQGTPFAAQQALQAPGV